MHKIDWKILRKSAKDSGICVSFLLGTTLSIFLGHHLFGKVGGLVTASVFVFAILTALDYTSNYDE